MPPTARSTASRSSDVENLWWLAAGLVFGIGAITWVVLRLGRCLLRWVEEA